MFLIEARRWSQKTYGNTYHSVMVTCFDGVRTNLCTRGMGCKYRFECFTTSRDEPNCRVLGINNFAYGYGEQYLMTAFNILAEVGIFPYEKTDLLVNCGNYWKPKESENKNRAYFKFKDDLRTRRSFYLIRCYDMKRKRDLAFNSSLFGGIRLA